MVVSFKNVSKETLKLALGSLRGGYVIGVSKSGCFIPERKESPTTHPYNKGFEIINKLC